MCLRQTYYGRLSVRSRLRSFKVFISAKGIYLSIGSEIARLIADSVSKDSFLLVQFKKFPRSLIQIKNILGKVFFHENAFFLKIFVEGK